MANRADPAPAGSGEFLRRIRSAGERWSYERGLRSAERLTLPRFLGIGAARAGSTWLWENLRCHPALFLPEKKELHHWDQHYHSPLAAYARWFEAAGDRLPGEVTPGYSILPCERVGFIRRVMPEVRLLLLLRNPVERAWSAAIRRLVRVEGRPFEELSHQALLEHLTSNHSRSRGDYESILDTWLDHFPQEQLWIGYFEEIAERPRDLMTEVFRHIGVEPPGDWAPYPLVEKSNPNPPVPFPPQYRAILEEMYAPGIERLAVRLGGRAAEWRAAGSTRGE